MSVLKQISFKIESNLKALDGILCQFDQLNQSWIPRKDWLQCQLALAEGFTNAVRHAHRNLPPEIPIEIEIKLFEQNLEIRIWDYGPPFDLETVLQSVEQKDTELTKSEKASPFQGEVSLTGHGKGLPILQKIADRLSYHRTDDNRNCLLVVKEFYRRQQRTGNNEQ